MSVIRSGLIEPQEHSIRDSKMRAASLKFMCAAPSTQETLDIASAEPLHR